MTKTTTKPVIVAPHPAAEIGVYGLLRKGVRTHRVQVTNDGPMAVCSGKPVRRYSFGWAKSHEAIPCGACFGGQP